MSGASFTESIVEHAALEWLEALGYTTLSGLDIAPETPEAERQDYAQVILEGRLRQALARLNPGLPAQALEDAFRRLTRLDAPSLEACNRRFHRLLVEGVTVEIPRPDGTLAGLQARVLDFDQPENNDWLAVNQFTVVENKHNRRPDIVLFVNGLPLAVFELKNAADEKATIWQAYHQLQTYKQEIPSLFTYNEALFISDGLQARLGSLTGNKEWFLPWRTITGEGIASHSLSELQVALEGVFEPRRFLDMIRYFIVFEDDGSGKLLKKMAGYHQYHAVNVALQETLRACRKVAAREPAGRYLSRQFPGGEPGDQRVGVIWHTQGAGKSLTMAFYAGRVILHPEMHNPTLVVLTDRIDLDNQLFGVFSRCQELLRQQPVQARDRADLRQLLRVNAGGVVFTTVQKFFPDEKGDRYPLLSDRRNIVVIADEAHRS
ncbi:MAG: type I restriction endonuclease subunit R, partial [Anaerolineales bacterium]|nr:type I restriction endonuclease subunit R [Anaerolineales bacterium]